MGKGLSKAERHEWRYAVRWESFITARDLMVIPPVAARIVAREMCKRRWLYNHTHDAWYRPGGMRINTPRIRNLLLPGPVKEPRSFFEMVSACA